MLTLSTTDTSAKDKRERVVILGSGWAGYALARTLDPAKFERILISPRSHFVFTPLLASSSVGTIEFRAVLEPVRRLRDITFHQGWADDIDFAGKTVLVEPNARHDDLIFPNRAGDTSAAPHAPRPNSLAADGGDGGSGGGAAAATFAVPFDRLVVAVGAYSQTFGIPGVREHAHFLRDVADARRIRLRVLALFEAAADPTVSDAERRALLRFAVVGGGPTGIEFAAELHDLVRDDLARVYPALVPLVDITVYDIAPAVLPMFDRNLAGYATELFARQGIRVRTETHLDAISRDEGSGVVRLKIREDPGPDLPVGLVVWSTGLMQNPLVEKLVRNQFHLAPAATDGGGSSSNDEGGGGALVQLAKDAKTGGILTDAHMRARVAPARAEGTTTAPTTTSPTGQPAEVLPDVFVIGDCAVVESDPALPKTAQVASQQAVYLGKRLNKGTPSAEPFRFRNWGTMAYLGGWRAIHQSSADELKGRAAWVLWRTAYLTYSMSVRNKIMVPFYWFMSWLFGRDISRF